MPASRTYPGRSVGRSRRPTYAGCRCSPPIFLLRFSHFPDFSAALHFSCPRFHFAFLLHVGRILKSQLLERGGTRAIALPFRWGAPTTDDKTRNTHVDGDRRRKNTAMDRPTKHVATLACVRARERARAGERASERATAAAAARARGESVTWRRHDFAGERRERAHARMQASVGIMTSRLASACVRACACASERVS